ncbi:hypothetical protein [Bradyrhizobium japonicum]|uniref:hypothetical protein n=1 Tax=Bradyrhizobium japonicum TaxID=375 RepID=UPI001269AA75|nr:hypothetical protein [Bradyrhizobium japonicum]
MGTIVGYVTVFESSDGGTGDPHQTLWQFFVDPGNAARQNVITKNTRLADTMRFAVKLNSRVRVSYDDTTFVMAQARIEFSYLCEELTIQPCRGVPLEPKMVCVTRRYSPCRNEEVPKLSRHRSAPITRKRKRARVA